MNSIKLTKEHESKLLEMCKILFPEYKYWCLHDGTCDLCTKGTLNFHKNRKPHWNSWNRIHWFEFCAVYILNKLYKSTNDLHNFMDICFRYNFPQWDIIHQSIHPIDYLYEEFQKLQPK